VLIAAMKGPASGPSGLSGWTSWHSCAPIGCGWPARFPFLQLWCLAAAAVVAVGALGSVVLGAEESQPPPVLSAAMGRVQVHRVDSQKGTEEDPRTGMSLLAKVETLGLQWKSLRIEVRLRTKEGQPVRVLKSAPSGYADDEGRFWMATHAPIWANRMGWPALRASFPYEQLLDLPGPRDHRLIASFQASCEGLCSVCEVEFVLPSKVQTQRAVRLLAIDVFPDTTAQADAEPSAAVDRPRGLAVWAYVEAVGLDGRTVTGRLSLYQPPSSLVTDGVPRRLAQSCRSLTVAAGQAQILYHFIPHSRLGLAPGDHRVLVRYSASCDGLKATMDEVHRIRVPLQGAPPTTGRGGGHSSSSGGRRSKAN